MDEATSPSRFDAMKKKTAAKTISHFVLIASLKVRGKHAPRPG